MLCDKVSKPLVTETSTPRFSIFSDILSTNQMINKKVQYVRILVENNLNWIEIIYWMWIDRRFLMLWWYHVYVLNWKACQQALAGPGPQLLCWYWPTLHQRIVHQLLVWTASCTAKWDNLQQQTAATLNNSWCNLSVNSTCRPMLTYYAFKKQLKTNANISPNRRNEVNIVCY